MSDAATAAGAVSEGRALAEALMVDVCTIKRAITGRTFNTAAGQYVDATATTIYHGPCQVQISSLGDATTPSIEGGDPTVQQLVVKVPVDETEYRIQDLVIIDAAAHDPRLPGRRFRVTALHGKTYATARRLQCEELTDV